jgi:hypothetical protein
MDPNDDSDSSEGDNDTDSDSASESSSGSDENRESAAYKKQYKERLVYSLDDESATKIIGQWLACDFDFRCLERMTVCLVGRLSVDGARAFLLALRESNVTHLRIFQIFMIWPDVDVWQFFYRETISFMRALTTPRLNDYDASLIAEPLAGNTNLHTLSVTFDNLTANGARCFVRGLKASKIQKFEMHINTRSYSAAMEIVFVGAIQKIPDIVLSHPLNNENALSIGRQLTKSKTLMGLRIIIGRNVNERGCKALADGIRRSRIERLAVDFGKDSTGTSVLIAQGIKRAQTVRHLSLRNIHTGGETLKDCLPRLQSLEIDRFELGHLVLGLFLNTATQLELLKLTSCTANRSDLDTFSSSLGDALPFLVSLRILHLRKVLIGNEGVQAIAANLNHSHLNELYLDKCDVGNEGLEHVITAAANHPTLAKLDLRRNLKISLGGIETVGRQLPNLRLKELNLERSLSYDEIDSETLNGIKARKRASETLAVGMHANFSLRVLDVTDLNLDRACKETIDFYLNLNKHGRYLLNTHHDLPAGVWSRILAKCQDKASMIYFFLREQPMLVSVSEPVRDETPRGTGRGKRRRRT